MNWNAAGHEWAANLLQDHIIRGDVRHAYLFTGPAGVGRRTLALEFARALNCLTPPAPGDYCGTCRVCRQTAAMQHSDLQVIQAEKEGGTLKVEAIREAQRSLSLLPYEARYRVALLLRFEEANANAQNALLKTLEEAPRQVILLITAASAESLLPTIVSRCEMLRLRPMPLARLETELIGRGLAQGDARLLAHLSGGRMGEALHLREEPSRVDQRSALIDDLLQLIGSPRRQRFHWVEDNYQDREAVREAYGVWLSFWRDLLLAAASPELPLVNLDRETEIRALASQINLSMAKARVTDLEQAIARLDSNVNARLLTEVLLLDWPRVEITLHDHDLEHEEE
jgi:DNA polymerase-3 subunit delta'